MQNQKRQKEQAARRHQEQALDEIESFPVRSWSGRKRFAQSWDEDVVAMPEAPPNARDPWRSPASKSRGGTHPELQRHEEVEEEEEDDDDDDDDDLEEMDDLDDQFENGSADEEDLMQPHSLGGNKSIGADLLMGSEKTNGGLNVSPIASPRRPLADSTNAQSVIFPSENGEDDSDVGPQRKPSRLPRRRKKNVDSQDLMDEDDEH